MSIEKRSAKTENRQSPAATVKINGIQQQSAAINAIKKEQLYEGIFKQSPFGLAIIDAPHGVIWQANKNFSKISGLTSKQLNSTDWMCHFHPEDKKNLLQKLSRLKDNATDSIHLKARFIHKDEAIIWATLSIVKLNKSIPKCPFYLCTAEDITEKMILEERNAQLLDAMDNNPASIVITNLDGTIEYVNKKFTEISGYTYKEAIGKNPRILKSGKMTPEEYQALWRTIISGNTWNGELYNKRKDGTFYWENASISPLTDSTGKIIKFVAAKEDITERKKIEAQLIHTSTLLEKTSELSKIGGWELDLPSMNLIWTKESYLIHDLSFSKKITIASVLKFYPKQAKENMKLNLKRAIETGESWHYEYPITTAKGRHIWIKAQCFPKMVEGKVVKINGTFQDITDIKLAEIKFNNLFDITPLPMWIIDPETRKFLKVNQAAIETYEYSNDEFMQMTLLDIRPKEEIAQTEKLFKKLEKSKSKKFVTKLIHQKKSGELMEVEVHGGEITIDGKKAISSIIVDITENNRIEHEISKAILKTQEEERFEISGELHDNISQILVAGQIGLGMLENSVAPDKKPLLEQSRQYVTLALQEIRNLSHRLSPVFLADKTLEDAVYALIKAMNTEGKYKIHFYFDNNIRKRVISAELQLNIYRILQEQLKNIHKHAHASLIAIDLKIQKNDIFLRIEDNGVGFSEHILRHGIGIANMKRRTESFNGKFNIESSDGNGCIIEAIIPIKENAI